MRPPDRSDVEAGVTRDAPLLRTRGLTVTIAGELRPLVRDATLELRAGDWVALTGANGSGKTTLGLTLAGLRRPAAGIVEIDGRADRDRLRVSVAIVFQEPQTQLLQTSVRDELAFTSRNLGRPEHAIAAAVARRATQFGLESELDRDPTTLSAGRQQMVALAAALVAEPRLLVLDEAGAYLDAESRARVLVLMKEEVSGGLALLWITQEPEEISAARRVWAVEPADGGSRLIDAPRDAGRRFVLGDHPRLRNGAAAGTSIGRIHIAAWKGDPGPRIAVAAPFEISIPSRGVVGILGRNGVGKSILLSAATGVVECPQVRVAWSEPPSSAPILAGQYPELQIFEERAADEIVFAAVSRGIARGTAMAAARRALDPLGDRGRRILERRSHELSAGEKRILQVVGALIAPAGLRGLDEPTAGLDPQATTWLGRLVREVGEAGPVLVATQDVAWIDSVGDRVSRLEWSGSNATASTNEKTD